MHMINRNYWTTVAIIKLVTDEHPCCSWYVVKKVDKKTVFAIMQTAEIKMIQSINL